MTSSIDTTKPVTGMPTTASVRANFSAAKSEIEALQAGTSIAAVPASIITGQVVLTQGGTGSATASGARTNLGLGSIATQAASAVAITGGSIAGASLDGVLGATTPAAATVTTLAATGNVRFGPAPSLTTNPVTITGDGGARNITMARFQSAANGPTVDFFKSRGTVDVPVDVVQGDNLGSLAFYGNIGGARVQAATIIGLVDAAPGGGIIPGGLRLDVANSSGALTQRLLIGNDGIITVANRLRTSLIDTASGTLTLSPADGRVTNSATNALFEATDGSIDLIMLAFGTGNGVVGTVSNHPLQLYANNAVRVQIGTDGTTSLAGPPGSESLRVVPVASADRCPTSKGSAGGDSEFGTTAGRISLTAVPALPSFTVATLPTATSRGLIYVSDGTLNQRLAVADGSNWRFPSGLVVS